MNTRQLILGFHYAERAKSGLFLLQRLMDTMAGLSGEEKESAKKLLTVCTEGVRSELVAAEPWLHKPQLEQAVQQLQRIEEDIRIGDISGAHEALAQCVSAVTTVSQRTMEALLAQGLL